jgi:hypothetical protein
MAWQGIDGTFLEIDREDVDKLNTLRAIYSEEFIYCHIRHNDVARMAVKYKSSRPRPDIDGFRPKKFGKVVVPRRW